MSEFLGGAEAGAGGGILGVRIIRSCECDEARLGHDSDVTTLDTPADMNPGCRPSGSGRPAVRLGLRMCFSVNRASWELSCRVSLHTVEEFAAQTQTLRRARALTGSKPD